jgi:hypothetical protein
MSVSLHRSFQFHKGGLHLLVLFQYIQEEYFFLIFVKFLLPITVISHSDIKIFKLMIFVLVSFLIIVM